MRLPLTPALKHRTFATLAGIAALGIATVGWTLWNRPPAPSGEPAAERQTAEPSPKTDDRAKPASVTAASEDALPSATGSIGKQAPLESAALTVTRQAGEIMLAGRLPDELRAAVPALAQTVAGRATIVDRTDAAAMAPGSVAATRFALSQAGELATGSVELNGNVLTIAGQARDKQALATVTASLRQPPDGLRIGSIALNAAPVAPYTFVAKRVPGAVVLSGYYPDPRVRDEIAEAIRSRFFHERIVDETRLADGAPARFVDGVRFAIENLSQLAAGEASLVGTALKVSGETLYGQTAEHMRDAIGKAPPAGWKATADIRLRLRDTETE